MRPPRALLCGLLAGLGGCLLAGLVAALLPAFALDGGAARAALFLSDLGGQTGTPLVMLVCCAALAAGGKDTRRLRCGVFALCFIGAAFLVQALLNEHLIKEQLAVPRPSVRSLHEAGVIPDVEAFYRDSKPVRRAALWLALDGGRAAIPGLPMAPEIRAHWVHEAGFSFPSGHSVNVFALAACFIGWGLVRLRKGRAWLLLVLLFACATAVSRTVLGVHSVADITVGGALGSLSGTLMAGALMWLGGEWKPAARGRREGG